MIAWLKERSQQLIRLEKDSTKLAFGCSLGIYIAFSPFIGFHTAMTFLFSWLFGLNVAVLFTVSMLINNPWTMVPVYGLGYWFGDFLFSCIGFNHHAYNPQWVLVCNAWLQHYIAWEGFSFWAFMLGGNVLGILFALISYPIITWLVTTVGITHKDRVIRTMLHSKQAVNAIKAKATPVIQRVTQKSRLQRTVYEGNSSK